MAIPKIINVLQEWPPKQRVSKSFGLRRYEENVESSYTKGTSTPTSFDALSRLKFLHSETNGSAGGASLFGEHKVV
jgi:hypothetical protein